MLAHPTQECTALVLSHRRGHVTYATLEGHRRPKPCMIITPAVNLSEQCRPCVLPWQSAWIQFFRKSHMWAKCLKTDKELSFVLSSFWWSEGSHALMCMSIYAHTEMYRDNSNTAFFFFLMGKKRQIDLEQFLDSWGWLTKIYNGKIKENPNQKGCSTSNKIKTGWRDLKKKIPKNNTIFFWQVIKYTNQIFISIAGRSKAHI